MSTTQTDDQSTHADDHYEDERSDTDTDESGERDRTTPNPRDLLEKNRPDPWLLIWSGAMLSAGVALLGEAPVLLLVSLVAVGVLLLREIADPPKPNLVIEREFSTRTPEPGETVSVTTTVRNVGSKTLPDCRIVDEPPGDLRVTDGSPRRAVRLGPGQSCTFEYEVTVAPGQHRYRGLYVVVSDVGGTQEYEYRIEAPDELICRPQPTPLQAPVLRQLTTPYAGRLSTEQPGEGLEFHSVREYRTGDPLKRIDWNQYATTRELTTLEFRTERAAAVVLVADVRKGSYVRSDSQDRHAANRGLDAVSRLFVTLLEEDHRVGLATLGPNVWFSPGNSTEHRNEVLDALATHEAFSSTRPTREYPIRLRTMQLMTRMTETTQVIICSPLLDDYVEIQIQILESAGHEVAVVSPDPTRMDGAGNTVAKIERNERINRIHSYGIPVIDWSLDENLDIAISETMQGWST